MNKPKPAPASPQDTALTANSAEAEKLLDKQDILQLLHISARTLQKWRTQRILTYSKIGGKIFYRRGDVDAMLQQNRVQKDNPQ